MEATRARALRARPGELGRHRQLALRKRLARQGLHALSPPSEQVSKVTCFMGGGHSVPSAGDLLESNLCFLQDFVRFSRHSPSPLCGWSSPTAGSEGPRGVRKAHWAWSPKSAAVCWPRPPFNSVP